MPSRNGNGSKHCSMSGQKSAAKSFARNAAPPGEWQMAHAAQFTAPSIPRHAALTIPFTGSARFVVSGYNPRRLDVGIVPHPRRPDCDRARTFGPPIRPGWKLANNCADIWLRTAQTHHWKRMERPCRSRKLAVCPCSK